MIDSATGAISVAVRTTGAAAADDLTEAEYRDIYSELRGRMSLRAFVALVASGNTIGYWSKWERTPEQVLHRQARNELRLAVGLAELPPTVEAVLAQAVDPDATVYLVGTAPADRVVLVGRDTPPVTLRINGRLDVIDPLATQVETARVSPDTRVRLRQPTRAIRVRPETFDRLSTLRREAGLSWDEFGAWVVEQLRQIT